MKRERGFFAAQTLVWALLFMLVAGFALERATHRVLIRMDRSPFVLQNALARIGSESAEDWIASSFENWDPPRSNGIGEGIAKIIAKRSDGRSFVDSPIAEDLSRRGVEVIIADTSYDLRLLPDLPDTPVPSIAHVSDPEHPHVTKYSYFIRSSSRADGAVVAAVRDELIAVTFDSLTGHIEMKRIYHTIGGSE